MNTHVFPWQESDFHRPGAGLVVGTALAALAILVSTVHAGGMMLHTRGVETTARAGAAVAGADGAAGIGLNPAALATEDGSAEYLVDLSYVRHDISYTRVDSNLLEQDTVQNAMAGIPIPTLALAVPLNERLTLGAGLYAPYGGAGEYPDDGAQRYSLVSMRGSLILVGELAMSYQISDRVRIGAGVQNMYVKLTNRMAFSACPGNGLCDPEDPTFDMQTIIEQEKRVNLSGTAGVQIDVSDRVRLGASVQLPYNISGTGTFRSSVPDLGLGIDLGDAEGTAVASLTLPASVRAGLEIQPTERVAIELATHVQMWSATQQLDIQIQDLEVGGLISLDPGSLGESGMPLNLRDTYAFMAGVEVQPIADKPLTLMAGYAYETSAVTDEYMNVLTVDGNKHLVTGGLTVGSGSLRFHAVVGLARVEDTEVSPDEGLSEQVNPLLKAVDRPAAALVNWGRYQSSWLIAGAGVSGTL